jgi:2'-5' RNA ligase
MSPTDPAEQTHRAFIAARLEATRPLLDLLDQLGAMGRAVRPTAATNLHITMRFLGGTLRSYLPKVAEAIAQAAADEQAFEMELHGLGAFPRVSRPSIVWLGTRRDDPLYRIVESLNAPLEALGFGGEPKPWHSHATVARVKGRPPQSLFDLLRRGEHLLVDRQRIASIDLVTSELLPRGPRYTVAESIALKD